MLYLAYTLWALITFAAVMGFGYCFMVLTDRAFQWNERRHARAVEYRARMRTSRELSRLDLMDDLPNRTYWR